jgi:hypothetical protein
MTMTSQVAASRITREIQELEDALDLALARKSAVVASFTQARVDLKAPGNTGQVAMMRLAAVEKYLVAARGDAIRAHEELYQVGCERGDIATDKPPAGSLDRFLMETAEAEAA